MCCLLELFVIECTSNDEETAASHYRMLCFAESGMHEVRVCGELHFVFVDFFVFCIYFTFSDTH